MTQAWLIGDEGDVWPEGHPSLGRRLGTQRMGNALTEYVVRNLGFIRISQRGNTPVAHFCPATVSEVAVAGLGYWLLDRAGTRLIVEQVDSSEPPQLLATLNEIHGFLGRIVDNRAKRPDFLSQPLEATRSQFLARRPEALDILRSDLSSRAKGLLLERMFEGRCVISALDPESGHYRLTFVGRRYDRLERGISERDLGKTFAEARGGAYGRWLTQTLDAVRDGDMALADFVEAVVQLERQRPRRLFYERLLLPVTLASGRRELLTVTTAA